MVPGSETCLPPYFRGPLLGAAAPEPPQLGLFRARLANGPVRRSASFLRAGMGPAQPSTSVPREAAARADTGMTATSLLSFLSQRGRHRSQWRIIIPRTLPGAPPPAMMRDRWAIAAGFRGRSGEFRDVG